MDPELAEALLLEHYRKPRNSGQCDGAAVRSEQRDNPLCGDVLTVSLELGDEDGACQCLSFEGQGCALSQAGASIVLSSLGELPAAELRELLPRLVADLETGNAAAWDHGPEELLALFFAAAENPARIRCAALGAEALLGALGSD